MTFFRRPTALPIPRDPQLLRQLYEDLTRDWREGEACTVYGVPERIHRFIGEDYVELAGGATVHRARLRRR